MKIYTQAELEGMSDDELNDIATKLKYSGYYAYYYPCASWGDCGALIDECGIGLYHPSFDRKEWSAYIIDEVISVSDNPKRAVTIVYILIKQGE